MLGATIEKYKLVSELGQGGMGVVYLGEHEVLGTKVAIKLLRREYSEHREALLRFFQEAKASTAIKHSAIIRVLDFGTHPDKGAYLIMEYLEGQSLSGRLEERGALPLREVLTIGRQIAEALRAAHQAGIVHRDLKPDNIFVIPDPEVPSGERIKLLDFGLAKLAREVHSVALTTHLNAVMGTPYYMSPEQCRGAGEVDYRTDMYSLGCVLFELICGERPFSGGIGEVLGKHQYVPAPSPRTLRPDLPEALEALIVSCLEKDASRRPQSMAEISQTLASISQGPSEAPAPKAKRAPLALTRAENGALFSLEGHQGWVVSARFSPDGTRIATASFDKTANLWDAQTGELLSCLRGHEDALIDAWFSRDGEVLATVSMDKTAKLWEVKSGALRFSLNAILLDLHPNSTRFAAVLPEGGVSIYSLKNRLFLLSLSGHQSRVLRADFSPDGASIVTASSDQTAKLWDAQTGRLLHSFQETGEGVTDARFSKTGKKIVLTTDLFQSVIVYDARPPYRRLAFPGYSVDFSPDDSQIATVREDATLTLFHTETGEQLFTCKGHSAKVTQVAFSPDGTKLVSASFDKTAKLWDAQTGEALRTLAGHQGKVKLASFSPDGSLVVTASLDNTAKLWAV